MSELVRFLSGDNDVAQKTQMDPQNPTAKFVPLEPGQVLFGLEVVEDGSLLGTIYYDYKDKNGIITRVSMGNGGAGGSGGGGGIIRTLATTDGKHESDETTAKANVVIPLPKKIFADLLSAKTQFNFPKVHDPSNAAYVNEDAAPGQSYLYGNGLHMINPFNTLQDSWIRTIGKSGSAEATLELAMRDNASNEYIYDQIVARHYKADGTIVTDTDGHKREVVILGKEGESQFPGPVTSQRGFVGDVDGNAKSATKAKQDWYDQVIDSTYLSKIVKTTHNGSKFEITSYDGRYTPVGSADAKKDVITIPGATATLAGLVTTGDQTITGNKTIDSSGTLTIMKQGGFIYSGIQEDKATDKNLPIWFSTGTANGTPNYSTELTYNPSTGTVTAKKFAGPATSATYDAEGGAIHDKYLKRAGGTMTGALNFADNTYNKFGDDVEVGSRNATGKLTIHGLNGTTGIIFAPYSGSTSQTLSIDGAGVMTITGTLKATLSGNASTATTLQTARNFHITDSSATYNGPNASFNGSADVTLHMPSTFVGTLKGNADSATIARSLGADNGMKMYAHNSNEINFGGTNTSTTLYFGYRATDSRPIPTKFVFGGSTGTATLVAATFQGALSGNATTATTLKTARNFHITDSSATYNGPNASFNGSADITLHMPSTFAGSLKGNADTATNADKLDGYHRKGLYTSPGAWINANEYTKTVTVEGDANTYYPVVITTTSEKEAINYISVWKNLGSKTAAYSSGNHSNGTSSMWLIYEARNWFWDGNGGYLKCWYRSMPYANLCAKAEAAGSGVGALVVYLRGGGTTYNISTTYAATVTVYLASTNIGSSSSPVNVAPTTSNGNLGKLSTVVLGYGNLDGNAGTATKWQTARNFQVDLALDNPATVAVDGTKDVILPVTGILATKHGGTGNSSHTANRLVWSETATKLSATNNHYVNASKIAVNYTSAPSTNFYVNGTSYLNGDTTINGQLYMALSNAAITWNQGTYWQRMITEDDSTSGTHIFKFQVSSNSGSSWTDILRLANNGQIRVQNNVGGIYKLQTTASTTPAVQVISDNQDSSIFKVASGTAFVDSWSCGFDLKYIGTGAGVNNLLTLYAGDYANTQTQVIGWSVNQAGQMGIKTTPSSSYSLNINGNTYSNGKFYINNTSDASLTADGAVVIGPTSGENLTLDTNEIMARNNKAASTLYLNNEGGLVQIGSGGLLVNGQVKTTGPLLIGSDTNGRTKNYIAFYGITGDGPDTWNHTFIGENLFGDSDKSELILFKGNDPGSTPEDMRYASGPGPDRIRHIAAGHLFQIYRTALSGTFATIAQSTVPINIFEVNQQGVVVYNEGTDAQNYPAKITFKVKDTVKGTTSTAMIAAYSDHGTASYGSNLYITSNGNTVIQAGDGTYGSYANLIGTGVNQGENLYLTADGSIQLCAIADTANRKLIWDGTTFYPSISNTFHLGSKSYRWASAHIYRDFNIYGNESTGDESHVRFNASDNSQRAIIAFNGNTTNTLDATTHLKIATNYGDIRLDAASNYINVKGHILPRADFTATNYNIGSTTRRWGNVYANALRLQGPSSDPSEAQGARIEFAYDNGSNRSQPVYISYTPNDGYRVPYGLKIFGTDAANYGAWLEVQGAIGTSNTNASSGIGISLYGGPVNGKPAYGMFFGGTATFGKLYNTTATTYGVSSDWATYFTMSDTTNRGWLFMRGATNVAGITGNGTFLSRISTGTHIAGNQGNVIIDGTAGAGYNMLFRQKSTNGVFTGGAWNAAWHIFYTADTTISAGTNSTTYGIRLINEAGNTQLNRLGVNGENTGYRLYVNGTSFLLGNTTIQGHLLPQADSTYDVGSTSMHWRYGYYDGMFISNDVGFTASTGNQGKAGTFIGTGYMEMTASTPYIDFHNANSTADFSARIISDGANRLSIKQGGTPVALSYNSRSITPLLQVNGVLYASSAIESADYFLNNRNSAGGGFYVFGNNKQYGRLFMQTMGTAEAIGITQLELGNNVASGTVNNSRGRLYLYGQTASTKIQLDATTYGNIYLYKADGQNYYKDAAGATATNYWHIYNSSGQHLFFRTYYGGNATTASAFRYISMFQNGGLALNSTSQSVTPLGGSAITFILRAEGAGYFNGDVYGTASFIANATSSTTGRGFIARNNNVQYARMYVSTVGTAGDGTNAGTTGVGLLILGNSTAVSSTSGTGANNARGVVRLYGSNANYTDIYAQANGNRTLYLPNYNNTMYLVHAGNNNAVGSATVPVYIAANGRVTACSGTMGLAATSANALNKNTRMEYGWDGLNYFNISGTAGNAAKVNDTPTTAWWHIIRCNHANASGYYTDLAIPFNATSIYYKRITNGAVQNSGWVRVLDALNYSSYAIPKSGGTMSAGTSQIQRAGSSVSWYQGRTNAFIRINSFSGYNALYSLKTTNGDWSCGVYTNDTLYWTYITDTNFNANTNTVTAQMYLTSAGYLYAPRIYKAVWNDYAEFRQAKTEEPGRVVIEGKFGIMELSTKRLQPGGNIISDTYGDAMGQTEKCKTPIAVAGRVLAYTYEDRESYELGDAVCTGPNGTVSKMTREEIREWPDRIIGTVSEIPTYEIWGQEDIKVNGRIWIKVC